MAKSIVDAHAEADANRTDEEWHELGYVTGTGRAGDLAGNEAAELAAELAWSKRVLRAWSENATDAEIREFCRDLLVRVDGAGGCSLCQA